MLVTILGVSALLVQRVQRRSEKWSGEMAKARSYAHTAVQMGFLLISQDPDWRTNRTSGTWINGQAVHDGTFSLSVVDPNDGDLADSPTDSVVLTGTGYMGSSRHRTQVTLVADVRPLAALNTCLHAAGQIEVKGGKSITVTGAPLSTNGDLDNNGTVCGDVHAATISDWGTITGDVTVPASPKGMPDAALFERYHSLATEIANPDTMDRVLLTPGANPYGATNANGVYYIDISGHDLTIKDSRIHGTLVVRCGDKKLVLDEGTFLHNYRADYPSLIVDGELRIKLKSDSSTLSEAVTGNMNPPGSPYNGQEDDDATDEYPNEVQGLVHVRGPLEFLHTPRVRGSVICEDAVTCDDASQIIHLPSLYESPPAGYTFIARMMILAGSWKQNVD